MAEQKMRDVNLSPLPLTSSELRIVDIMPAMPETNAKRQLLTELSNISVALGGRRLQAASAAEHGGEDIS